MPQIICLRTSALISGICVIWGVFQVSRRKSCKQFLNMWGAARQQRHVETTSDHNSAAGPRGCLIIVWWKHNSVEVSTFNLDIYDTWTKSDLNFLLKLCILALKDFLHSPLTQLAHLLHKKHHCYEIYILLEMGWNIFLREKVGSDCAF